jgi:adhesin transport system membrane fusion protein
MKKLKLKFKRSGLDKFFDRILHRVKDVIQILPEKDPLNTRITGVFSHVILWVALIFVIVFVVWANFASIDEVTRAPGQVISSRKTQIIQNLEGGIVSDILVSEGQVVKKGQVLVRIDSTKFASAYRSALLQSNVLAIKIARITAELNNAEFKPLTVWQREMPDLVQTEKNLYQSRHAERQALMNQRNLLNREIEMTKPLLETGAVSEVELLRLKQRYHDITLRLNQFNSLAIQELNQAKAQQARLNEDNVAFKDRLDRTLVRSPVRGIVKQIHVSTVGGVIQSGMSLMEIVPLDDTLLVEAKVRPNDIGFLHQGQEAIVKITAYDYSIYGGIQGYIEHIGADTVTDSRGQPFYEIWVRTRENRLQKNGKILRIIPGMQASVDVLTGKKTVLDYLLKPILKAKHNALRER